LVGLVIIKEKLIFVIPTRIWGGDKNGISWGWGGGEEHAVTRQENNSRKDPALSNQGGGRERRYAHYIKLTKTTTEHSALAGGKVWGRVAQEG